MPIRRLAEDMINRIAAGEVVERPASVVKELVENAIDAGAHRIDIVTAAGGVALIRVTDDGCGMDPEDLALSVERHCTSKLEDGLERIATLGFRGEALASIGAAARLAVASRRSSESEAREISVEGGVLSPAPARRTWAGDADRGARSLLHHAGAAQISEIRTRRGDSDHRCGATAGNGAS